MRMRRAIAPGLIGLLLLAACSGEAGDPGGATPSEARQLNEAAAMLDEDSVSANALTGNAGAAR